MSIDDARGYTHLTLRVKSHLIKGCASQGAKINPWTYTRLAYATAKIGKMICIVKQANLFKVGLVPSLRSFRVC